MFERDKIKKENLNKLNLKLASLKYDLLQLYLKRDLGSKSSEICSEIGCLYNLRFLVNNDRMNEIRKTDMIRYSLL